MSDDLPPDDTPGLPLDPPLHEPLRRALGERYLQYALSTIMHRALPDARDGLKPVHRRILFAMRELKLTATGGFRKSAKISGDVMGNYHPHGDVAIYDAMARLAQDFNVRYPLVDGQGNFGNIDGDNPAASRYTEARLTAAAEALLEGLAENAVDFRPNYDGTLEEPIVLPAAFPNLLCNGASGIAVGKVFKPDLRRRAITRVFDAAFKEAGLAASVAEVFEDKKRGLVARLRRDGDLDEDKMKTLMGEYTVPWEWA